ncbi:phospholipid carrier-dependent glycosyltransferase [Candidatus Pacearchaeota archaeon]|nr:phospholipid carrier-dependent glycosyltransferase [Candidatus Pacearchaeota archaeon]
MPPQKEQKGIIEKFVTILFSKNEAKWLFLLVLCGFIFRMIIAAHNAPVADEMVHGSHAIGIASLGPLSTITQGPLWFYLTDFSYAVFGVTLWSGRLCAIVFGTFSIVLVFLLSRLFFSARTSLLAAALFAFSPYQLYWSRIYMDQSLLFFVLLASYFFLKDYRDKKYITPLSALFLGIGCLIKIISGVFIVVFSIFLLITVYRNRKDPALYNKSFRNMLYFFGVIGLCLVPLFAYNYFLYESKGIVDLPFAMYLGINIEVYQGPGLAHGDGFMLEKLPKNLKDVFVEYFAKQDPLSLILFGLGLMFFLRSLKKENQFRFEKSFLLTLIVFPLLFIAATIVLDTHYTYFTALFAIIAGSFFEKIHTSSSALFKKIAFVVFMILIIVNLSIIGPVFAHQSATAQLREFANDKITSADLVITDSRIYRGLSVWMFNDKHYLDAGSFGQVMDYAQKNKASTPVRTFFIECAVDDCGWGTIKDQPALNESMEALAASFKTAATSQWSIYGGGSKDNADGYEDSSLVQYRVYEVSIPLNPQILQSIDQTHNWFFYDIPRTRNEGAQIDSYTTSGLVASLLNPLAYLVLYVSIVLAFLAPLYTLYLVVMTETWNNRAEDL